jgi:hypothetical protein
MDTAGLIRLYAREDPEVERKLLGGLEESIVGVAQNELWDRLDGKHLPPLTEGDRKQLVEAIRKNLERWPDDICIWGFGAKFARDVTLEALSRSERAVALCPDDVWNKLYSNAPERTVAIFRDRIQRSTGIILCAMIAKAGDVKVKELGDVIYVYTRNGDWMVRAAAMLALAHMEDVRCAEALARNASDMGRGPGALSWLFDPMGASSHQYVQVELIRAVQKYQVHETEPRLESLALHGGRMDALVRASAGEALAAMNRPKGIAVARTLMGRWSADEQWVGTMIANEAKLEELRPELERLATKGWSEEVRDQAQQTLRNWSEGPE